MRTRGIEYLPLVPAVINPLYDAWDGMPLEAPRTVVTTAAPTPLALRRKLAELFPAADIRGRRAEREFKPRDAGSR